ncbi:MAG: LptF/LptG family permease [Deltaproteobacteria bacterium]
MGPRILDRYVFSEVAKAFLFCFAVFLVTGLIAGFLPLLQRGMEAGLQLTLILFQMLINALPSTLVTVLPLSITIGILLGLGRMSADNEIAAVKSSGIPVVRLLTPVLVLAAIGLFLSFVCTLVLIPKGISEGRKLMHEALTTRADAGIEERTFFDTLKGLILYVQKIDSATGVMTNIFIRESSNPDEVKTIIAKKGKVVPDPRGKAFILLLRDGTATTENRYGDPTGTLSFRSQTFRYPISNADLESSAESLEEMSIPHILDRIRKAASEEKNSTGAAREFQQRVQRLGRIILTQRFTYPLACLALALIAFPLGVINMGKSRLNNVSAGLVAIFIYYALSLATERLARSGLAPPEIVLPLPALFFIAVAAYFIHCVRKERIPTAIRLMQQAIHAVRRDAP